MKIGEIINELKFVNTSLPLKCLISEEGLKSNIYIVGQVRPSYPGVRLGDREPYSREKTVDEFIMELKTFGSRFQDNDFLIEYVVDLNETHYQCQFYPLLRVTIGDDEVILESKSKELMEFREKRNNEEGELDN